ncbi:MAG: hypothetical protein ACLUAR_17770 [Pilosibacter sp.]
MEYLKPKQAVTGRVILQLHGGGYIGPMKNIYRRFAVKYSELGFGRRPDLTTGSHRSIRFRRHSRMQSMPTNGF